MEQLITNLKGDISGELGIIATDQIINESGNIGIPASLIPSLVQQCKQLTPDTTMVLLCVHPDHYTAINYRKQLLTKKMIDPHKEYQFVKFVITKHLNKPMLWGYLFYIRQFFTSDLDKDIEFCQFAADRYRCNYPCWAFRRRIATIDSQELNRSKEFVKSHVSDSSGWSYRLWLMLQVGDTSLAEELEWIQRLIELYEKHESLWFYFRMIVKLLHKRECLTLGTLEIVTRFLQSLDIGKHVHYPYIAAKFIQKDIGCNLSVQEPPLLPYYTKFFVDR